MNNDKKDMKKPKLFDNEKMYVSQSQILSAINHTDKTIQFNTSFGGGTLQKEVSKSDALHIIKFCNEKEIYAIEGKYYLNIYEY